MKLGNVTGTIEATVKAEALSGHKLLLVDLVDGAGTVQEPALVAVDGCGAGVGDQVLVTLNSAARMPSGTAGTPTDATIIAIVDKVTLAQPTAKKRKS
ncbi:MAG: EutN/CcmL family microcompartment protein [Paracoccaceae bacterium]